MSAFAYDESLKMPDVERYDFVPYVELSDSDKKREKNEPKKDPDFHCWIFDGNKESEILESRDECLSCGFKFGTSLEETARDSFKTKLSNYIDSDKRNRLKQHIVLHRTGKFSLTFDIKKGNKKANDPDGFINLEISPSTVNGVSGTCTTNSKDKRLYYYDSQLKVDLDVSNQESFLCNLNFYSKDNSEDSGDWKGGVTEKVHCGEIGLVSFRCICADWPTIASVIPNTDFVGWPEEGGNCFKLAVQQIAKKDCILVDSDYNADSPNLFQIYKDVNSNKKKDKNNPKTNDLSGVSQKKRFKECIDYIKISLKDGIPLIAGVDHSEGDTGNTDKTTDHFITLVGTGKDNKGCFILFYDNAVGWVTQGASTNNKLYCDCNNYALYTERGSVVNTFVNSRTKYNQYVVTQVRKSKKNKK